MTFWRAGLLAATLGLIASGAHAQTYNWSGLYVGAFGGYGWGTQGQHDGYVPPVVPPVAVVPPPPPPPPPPPVIALADGHYGLSGALGGGVIGYQFPLGQTQLPGYAQPLFGVYPFNQLIVGVEGDLAGSSVSGSSGTCGASIGNPHRCGGRIPIISDVRVRFGIPFGQFMPFLAGGLAVDDIHAYDSFYGVSGSHAQAGWTAGGGIEYKITPQLSARVEYLYQSFDRSPYFDILPGVPERIRTDTNIVRAGIVWNFAPPPPPPPPVIAKY